jgi:hypothetical protein
MRRAAMLIGAAALLTSVGGCVTNPKQTVLNLDSTDPRWMSPGCVAVRKMVARYHDGETTRAIVGFAGNYAAPFAGTGAALLMSEQQNGKRADLNRLVKDACVTPRHHWL